MYEAILMSGRDALLVSIPLVVFLFMGLFRMDEAIISRKKAPRLHPPRRGVDEQGRPILSDPDGRQGFRNCR